MEEVEEEDNYMGQSLWLELEAFEELESVDSLELKRDPNDPNIVLYAGEHYLDDAPHIEEDVAVSIFANYKQVRNSLNEREIRPRILPAPNLWHATKCTSPPSHG